MRTESMERLQERQSGLGGRAVENTYSFVWWERDVQKWPSNRNLFIKLLQVSKTVAEFKENYTAYTLLYFWGTAFNQSSW